MPFEFVGINCKFERIIEFYRMVKRDKISIIFTAFLAVLLMPVVAVAQDARLDAEWQNSNRSALGVDFRVNSTVIDRTYRNNSAVLSRIDSLFNAVEADTLINIVSVEFCGSASPEGNSVVNSRLSRARMLSLESMVRDHLDISDDVVVYNDHYIAWHHLIQLVEADETLPYREQVLEVLRTEYPEAKDWKGVAIDGRIPELRKIGNGSIWYELNRRYFVQMRNAWFIMVTERQELPAPEPEPVPVPEPEPVVEPEPEPVQSVEMVIEPAPEPMPEPEPAPEVKPFVPLMNIKVNSLEVATLIANLGFEFRLAPRLSLDVMGHYSPYDYFTPFRKSRVFAIQPEVRYWWGESLIKGHFIGLHVPVTGFNIQLNDKYRYQDPNHALWGVGVSYGYAMPLRKDSKWGVEFTLGVGYMDITYDVYEGVHNGKYLRTETKNYWGLTRLGINFSYRIDMKDKSKNTKIIGE